MIQAVKTRFDPSQIICDEIINHHLAKAAADATARAKDAVAKALELKGLDSEEVAALLLCEDRDIQQEIFAAANRIKESIYGKRLVLFAPLYISNVCRNECLYCAFRADNKNIRRKTLSQREIASEVRSLTSAGQKRILLVASEGMFENWFDYILKSIETIYSVKEGRGEIRRLNVNIAPLTIDQFKRLKAAGIGTYQLFQESYHRPTYRRVHPKGPKSDYDNRIGAMDRAFQAGVDDVGLGVLFGLYDYRYEVLALLEHIAHLERRFGVGCHTISVPRIEPAADCDLAGNPPHPVSDEDFKKLVAILRLAVPYTGMIMSTRESPEMRAQTFALGVSQISAGSRTNPGGYGLRDLDAAAQFQLGDHRSLDEVIRDAASLGYVPSFCTACYRLGRTGGDFMDLAKPGLIKQFCLPNALLTFKEYLEDYAGPQTRRLGLELIQNSLGDIPTAARCVETSARLEKIEAGERDLYF